MDFPLRVSTGDAVWYLFSIVRAIFQTISEPCLRVWKLELECTQRHCITVSPTYTCVTISTDKLMQNMTLNAMSTGWVCFNACLSIHSISRYMANPNLNRLKEEAYSATGKREAEILILTMLVQQKIEVPSLQDSLDIGIDLIRGSVRCRYCFAYVGQ